MTNFALVVVCIILGLGAGVALFTGIIQGYTAYHSTNSVVRRQLKTQMKWWLLAAGVLVIATFCSSLWTLTPAFQRASGAPTPSTLISGPTATDTLIPGPTATDTLISGPTATDTSTADLSTPAATFPPNPAPATQVKDALPLLLNCHCPSNPLQIQVTDVHIDPTNGRMTWKLALRNISTMKHQVQLSHLVLTLDGQESQAEGGVMTNPLTLNPNEVEPSTITFTFVPQQATYTLKLGVWLDTGFSFSSVSYDDSNGNGTNQITFK